MVSGAGCEPDSSQGWNLALTVLHVSSSLDSGVWDCLVVTRTEDLDAGCAPAGVADEAGIEV